MPESLTNLCPYCGGAMVIAKMTCGHCQVAIEGPFPPSRLGNLPLEHQRFIEVFLLAGGSLKEVAERTGVSYPTVRSRLDKVIEALKAELAKGERAERSKSQATQANDSTKSSKV